MFRIESSQASASADLPVSQEAGGSKTEVTQASSTAEAEVGDVTLAVTAATSVVAGNEVNTQDVLNTGDANEDLAPNGDPDHVQK
jgi:hypothetical protein